MTLLDSDPTTGEIEGTPHLDVDDPDLSAELIEGRRAEDEAIAAVHADMSASLGEMFDRTPADRTPAEWAAPAGTVTPRRPWWSIFRRRQNATEQWWAEVYARRGLS